MTLVVGRRGWFSGGGGGLDGPDRVRVRVFADRRRRRRGRRSVAATAAPSATLAVGWDDDDDDDGRSLATAEIWRRCHRRPRRTVAGQRDRRRPSH